MNRLGFLLSVSIVSMMLNFCTKHENKPKNNLSVDKTELKFFTKVAMDSFIVTSSGSWKLTKSGNAQDVQFSTESGQPGSTKVYVFFTINNPEIRQTISLYVTSLEFPDDKVQILVFQNVQVNIGWYNKYGAKGGETFGFYGHGFSLVPSENLVTVNGVQAEIKSVSTDYLEFIVPAMAGTGPLVLSVGNYSDTSEMDFIYEWVGMVSLIAGGTEGKLDGLGPAAQFRNPYGIDFDIEDNLIVADYGNGLIRKISTSGQVSTLPGRIPASDNPTGPLNSYNAPTGVEVDGNGNIFIAEFISNGISKITASGEVSVIAGGNGSGFVNGIGTNAVFDHPVDIALDGLGNLFVADRENLCVRKITNEGSVSTFAGGEWGYENGMGTAARFNRPYSIDIDGAGNMFVADFYNNCIRKINPGGLVTTYAGNGASGTMNGEALTYAEFNSPISLAIGPDGVVYVSELYGNDNIRRVTPQGKVDTISSFIDSETGAEFQFHGIYGLAVNKSGVLYAADYFNNRIVKLTYK